MLLSSEIHGKYINGIKRENSVYQSPKYIIVLSQKQNNYDLHNINKEMYTEINPDSNMANLNELNNKGIFRFDIKKDRAEREKAKLVKSQHERKMKEITEFMKDHLLTTNYFYNEIKRIKSSRQLKDDLREMISYLEIPTNKDVKDGVLKCFKNFKA